MGMQDLTGVQRNLQYAIGGLEKLWAALKDDLEDYNEKESAAHRESVTADKFLREQLTAYRAICSQVLPLRVHEWGCSNSTSRPGRATPSHRRLLQRQFVKNFFLSSGQPQGISLYGVWRLEGTILRHKHCWK